MKIKTFDVLAKNLTQKVFNPYVGSLSLGFYRRKKKTRVRWKHLSTRVDKKIQKKNENCLKKSLKIPNFEKMLISYFVKHFFFFFFEIQSLGKNSKKNVHRHFFFDRFEFSSIYYVERKLQNCHQNQF